MLEAFPSLSPLSLPMRACLPLLVALAPAAFCHDNVLLLLLDDVGVDMVGAYGEGPSPARTPVIDGLAQDGVLFRNVWSNPCCSPTRATILTGRYSFRTGVGFVVSKKGHDLQLQELTLPEVFDPLVHEQAGFGKWHLTNELDGEHHIHPNQSGFDHWVGNYQNLLQPQTYFEWVLATNGVLVLAEEYATTVTVDAFLEWHAQQGGPWFAYVAFHAPHRPYHRPPADLHTEILPHVDPRLAPRPHYRAALEAVDTEIGRLLAGLGPDLAHTNVIVLGDNGTPEEVSVPPFEPDHAKLTPYEGGINVPLVVSGPAVVQPGRQCQALVNTTDLFTTAIELSGHEPDSVLPPDLVHDSVSIVPYLTDPTCAHLRDWVYAELWKPNGPAKNNVDQRMLRDDRYKIIRRGLDSSEWTFELYDLDEDPFEEHDLFHEPGGPTDEDLVRFDALRDYLTALLATE